MFTFHFSKIALTFSSCYKVSCLAVQATEEHKAVRVLGRPKWEARVQFKPFRHYLNHFKCPQPILCAADVFHSVNREKENLIRSTFYLFSAGWENFLLPESIQVLQYTTECISPEIINTVIFSKARMPKDWRKSSLKNRPADRCIGMGKEC